MQQEVVLAMLAKEPSQGYQLRARLDRALGPLGEAINAGQIYVTLGRLEKAGLVVRLPEEGGRSDRPDPKVYELTPAGQERVSEWLAEVSWPKPDLAEFHLKLIAAAQTFSLFHRGPPLGWGSSRRVLGPVRPVRLGT